MQSRPCTMKVAGTFGCIALVLWVVHLKAVFSSRQGFGFLRCLSAYNSAARLFNEGLCRLCLDMRSDVKGANIVYVDVYAIKYDLFASSTKYGFSTPLMACCRYGGPPYNYINIKVTWSTRLSGMRRRFKTRKLGWDPLHRSCKHLCSLKKYSPQLILHHVPCLISFVVVDYLGKSSVCKP
ncbi:hypothetical protein I3843_07G033000 [Carya illinoinensis]|nr:hypothetical protein I3843_07G033000 [Carya illinoinensis]